MGARLGCSACVLTATLAAAPAPQVASSPATPVPIDFGTLVARYRMGQFDPVVGEALRRTARELTEAAGQASPNVVFEAGTIAMLIDVACQSPPEYYREPIMDTVARRLKKLLPRVSGSGAVDLGRQAIAAERYGPNFIRLAYLAAVTCAQGLPGDALAWVLANQAVERFPDDPELLVARGSSTEFAASALARGRARPTRGMDRSTRTLWDLQMDAAVKDYARALALDSGLAEAHLRLGRVRWIQDRQDAARLELERASALAKGPYLRYLAALFLGALHERDERWSDAEAAYRSALDVADSAQSAVFALAALQFRQGRTSEARQRIEAWFAAQTPGMAVDPFFLYDFGQYWRINEYMAQLRRRVVQ